MKTGIFSIGMALAVVGATAAQAAKDPARLSDQELVNQLEAEAENNAPPCSLIPKLDEAQRRGLPLVSSFAALQRGLCALGSGRARDAIGYLAGVEDESFATRPPPARAAIDTLIISAAVKADDKAALAQHFSHLAERDNSVEFAALDKDYLAYAFWRLKAEDRGRVALRFVSGVSFAILPEDLREIFGAAAVLPAFKAGNGALADRLVGEMTSADSAAESLIDREWSAVWPALEKRVGGGMQAMLADQIRATAAKAAARPGDWELAYRHVSALEDAQQWAAVIQLSNGIDVSPKGLGSLAEHQGWILNSRVHALDWLGRRAEADAVFDALARINPEKKDWVVNFVINRADRLAMQGRWAEAEPAARLAQAVAGKHGSAYAKHIALMELTCAIHKLRPNEDISAARAQLEANWKDNAQSAVDFELCRDDVAAAKAMLIRGLDDPETRPAILRRLQPQRAGLRPDPFDGSLPLPETLRTDPEVRAVFNRYGRELPEEYWPRPLPAR